jgi:putative hydrolase of the HAD superfamily
MHLFFDLDNTLWDFDANSKKVLEELFVSFQLEQKLKTDFSSFHDFYVKKNDELWHLYYFNKIQKSELRYKRFHDSFLNFGLEDMDLSNLISEEYVRISPYSKALKPGCEETLDTLSKKYQLHIITNGFKEVQNIKIDNCGLRKYFKEIIISEEHNLTKPNIEIFRLAEKKADTTAERCIMIGDNWVSDIEGALGAGWKAIYLKGNTSVPEHPLVHRIDQLNEITHLVG